jgi:hypothetical protein
VPVVQPLYALPGLAAVRVLQPADGRRAEAAMNDNHDPAAEELLAVFVPWLRRALRDLLDAHPALRRALTAGASRVVLRTAPGDDEVADEVTRARARELLGRHGRRSA